MKPLDPQVASPLDVSIEELEALLEQARPVLSEEGYQKLHAAIGRSGSIRSPGDSVPPVGAHLLTE